MNFREGTCRLALLAALAGPTAFSQCAIKPIKPIPPLGCKDLIPQCVTDSAGKAYWTWACVRDEPEKPNAGGWPTIPAPRPQPLRIPTPIPATPAPPPSIPALELTQAPDTSWIKVGMPQQEALSGLAGHYKLTKEDMGGGKIEVWSVENLSQTTAAFSEIAFTDGRVSTIISHSAPLLQGDVLTLAQRLFADLYPRGDADNSKVGKFLGAHDLNVQVRMFQMTSDRGNEETMRFQFENGMIFEIKVNVPVKGTSSVTTSRFQTQ